MDSRAQKYYDNSSDDLPSRAKRNEELYKNINKTEVSSFPMRSNATVIGNSKANIDVEKIKSILDTHYNEVPKRKSLHLEKYDEPVQRDSSETKEYDINVILDKAKEGKNEDYDDDRSKKLRDTQFDILSNLDIDPKDYVEDFEEDNSREKVGKELEELINTITLKEKETNQIKEKATDDPLDIFEELKGDDDTVVLEGLSEKSEESENDISFVDDDKTFETKTHTTAFDNTFFTKSNSVTKDDFEDFEDIDKSDGSIVVKIIIIILSIIFVAGLAFLIKTLI